MNVANDTVKIEKNDLLHTIHEIQRLRETNTQLAAQTRVLDIVHALVFGQRSLGTSPDIVWTLRKLLEENQEKSE